MREYVIGLEVREAGFIGWIKSMFGCVACRRVSLPINKNDLYEILKKSIDKEIVAHELPGPHRI